MQQGGPAGRTCKVNQTCRVDLSRVADQSDSHAEEDIVLGTDPKAPPNGAQLRADVSAQDVGSARGGWEQACQD